MTGCSCCSNRILCSVSHIEDTLAVLALETAVVVVVVVSPSSSCNKLMDPAFLLLKNRVFSLNYKSFGNHI